MVVVAVAQFNASSPILIRYPGCTESHCRDLILYTYTVYIYMYTHPHMQ